MKRLLCALCAVLLLSGCTPSAPTQADTLTITATTYPVYLLALAVTEDIPGIKVERLDTGSVSCLHDYTLSVNDMKKIERADVLALNGAGLEDFMADALAATDAAVIDCSGSVALLPAEGHDHDHDGHDHGHFDPHYWMDPDNMILMANNLCTGLLPFLDEVFSVRMTSNTRKTQQRLSICKQVAQGELDRLSQNAALVTFHDGFAYFARAFDLPLLASIEEEAGSEASAKEIVRIAALVQQHDLPAIFTEVNGSDATANAIARETGCTVAKLSMLMDGREPTADDDSPIAPYTQAICDNTNAVIGTFPKKVVE